jgi:hypothetical protein
MDLDGQVALVPEFDELMPSNTAEATLYVSIRELGLSLHMGRHLLVALPQQGPLQKPVDPPSTPSLVGDASGIVGASIPCSGT